MGKETTPKRHGHDLQSFNKLIQSIMKQSNNLVPCAFDSKDIVIPEFWDNLFMNFTEDISNCIGVCDLASLFFLNVPCCGGDRAFKARILCSSWNRIQVTSLQDNGTIWTEEVVKLKALFMQANDWDDSDLYIVCKPSQDHTGRYISLIFEYYHTDAE